MATALRDRPEGAEILIVAETVLENAFPRARVHSLAEAVQKFFRDPSDETRSQLDATVTELRAVRRALALARWRGAAGTDAE